MAAQAFDQVGFLGDMGSWTAATFAAHRTWFDAAHELNRDAMRLLYECRPAGPQQLVAALLFRRALQSLQGCLILSARGMPADARTLVRSATESAIALAGANIVNGAQTVGTIGGKWAIQDESAESWVQVRIISLEH